MGISIPVRYDWNEIASINEQSGIDNFNSSKVRLELISVVLIPVLLLYFNSSKVRLEPAALKRENLDLLYFNSSKVRLELIDAA